MKKNKEKKFFKIIIITFILIVFYFFRGDVYYFFQKKNLIYLASECAKYTYEKSFLEQKEENLSIQEINKFRLSLKSQEKNCIGMSKFYYKLSANNVSKKIIISDAIGQFKLYGGENYIDTILPYILS